MLNIPILILLVIHSLVTYNNETEEEGFVYRLPKNIIEIDRVDATILNRTTFGYNEHFEVISITAVDTSQVYTAFITYNTDGLIEEIKQTSTSPLIPEKSFHFTYNGSNISQILSSKNGEMKQSIMVWYNSKGNSYHLPKENTNWLFDFDEDNNLKRIKKGDAVYLEINTNHTEGICKDIIIQPALFLIQDELEAMNIRTLSLFNTKEVKSCMYQGFKFLFHNKWDVFGNIVKVSSRNNPDRSLEFVVSYELNDMKQ